ncbi:flagellar hook-associated protein FlgK [Croceicoccus mobilis]|uniref:Flagellar hook-associated protein 1 n=1 Tax=Croceicoccus mobilis TaxID=1703339 RepID=A0A916YX30_9SPHN|nr:flagellar hook-associated protein FlgK [Croceicoccus mobilis]GGD63917.1 flagellar hook-associated protein 1 [Croceicoccus mobilis]
MANDLLSIAKSGARSSRLALDVTAQNIANAATEGYVRRSVGLAEVASTGGIAPFTQLNLSGVRVDSIIRNADAFRQSEVRRTGSDLARADAELAGLQNIETAIEQTGIYDSIVGFEAALQQLAADPVDPSLRAATIEAARSMAGNFNVADANLAAAGDGMRFEAAGAVEQVNLLSDELARVNLRLARTADNSGDQAALLDQRDLLLQQISDSVGISTKINADNTVDVRLGDSSGPVLVTGGTAASLTMTSAADGTVSFDLDGTAVAPSAGSLAGHAQALDMLAQMRGDLDTLATDMADAVNAAQGAGIDLAGASGTNLFTATGAGDIALAFEDGALIATAPAGAGAGSRDTTNLSALQAAMTGGNIAGRMDGLLFDISSTVAGRQTMRDTIATIADQASTALAAQSAVDLDEEAVNLVRFQQAFQASGRVMQVASELFDTILGIR